MLSSGISGGRYSVVVGLGSESSFKKYITMTAERCMEKERADVNQFEGFYCCNEEFTCFKMV